MSGGRLAAPPRAGTGAPAHLEGPPALAVRGLVKTYPGGARALDGLDLEVPQNAFYGLLGPNGAGKSTLIGAITGLVKAPPGRVFVFGHDAVADAGWARLAIGLAPQEVQLDRFLTAEETLVFHGRYFGMRKREARERAAELLEAFDLTAKSRARPRMLSGGMRRRLLLARALMHRPRLVILDEPTAGVDIELRRDLWRYLRHLHREARITVLLTTHYLEEAEELCERIALIRGGRVAAEGTLAELLERFGARRLADVYEAVVG